MDKDRKEHRDRLVVLSFVSILLMLVYGPAASWFVAADRVLYDRVAATLRHSVVEDAVILSIDPRKAAAQAPAATWTALVRAVLAENPARIVLTQAPDADPDGAFANLAAEAGNVPLFVPRGHPLAGSAHSGLFVLTPDGDGVLRRSPLWRLEDGVKFPSLPLARAMANAEGAIDPTVADGIDAVYLSGYAPLPRYAPDAVLDGAIPRGALAGKTVFVDAEPPLVGAVTRLPSGQHVTRAELTAALLADLAQGRMITAPAWIGAMEWLAPALLAIVAVLFIPGRKRRDIVLLTLAGIAALLLLEVVLLAWGRLRLDLGRPLLIFTAAGALTWWLAGVTRKAAVDAFRRGSDFLAAGRLEPAFAEFRRCEPSETLAAVMYKLSLAFEGQAKPERAEAVLQWLKSTQEPRKDRKAALPDPDGAPQRLGRYVIDLPQPEL